MTTTRRARRLAIIAIILGLGIGYTLSNAIDHRTMMRECQKQFSTQFNNPDGRHVWTSPACNGLSTDDKAEVYARTIVTYQEQGERR